MPKPALWIVGGPNGAGKTTLANHGRFRRLLHGVRFLNPDQVALTRLRASGRGGFADATPEELRRCFIEAAEMVEKELRVGLARGKAMGVESVLSTRKYGPLVEQVLAADGFFGLIYIALKDAALSRDRVDRRVARGGHDVPTDKLPARWNRSVDNLAWFARRAHRFWVVENSDSTPGVPPRLIAEGGGGQAQMLDPAAIPEITRSLAVLAGA
jgi:predicted ABC-type ATPase